MSAPRSIAWVLAVVQLSCTAPETGTPPAASADPAPPASHKTLSQRLEQKNGYKQDADGNWVPQSDQRSTFESKGKSPYFQGKLAKKDYKTPTYAKKSWWGDKQYDRKAYADDSDGSRFQKTSRFDQQGAQESGSAAEVPGPYQTGSYATSAAREAGRSRLAKPSDTTTDTRRKVYPAPEIIDWRQQRALSLDQSKGILGR